MANKVPFLILAGLLSILMGCSPSNNSDDEVPEDELASAEDVPVATTVTEKNGDYILSSTTLAAPTPATITTSPTTTSTASSVPETSETLSTTSTTTTTTTSAAPATTTTTSTTTTTASVVVSPVVLQVQVLNGSGVAGAAGRLTDKLSQAGYVVLPPDNAPQRYSSSAVYFADGWQAKAGEILQTAEIAEIEEVTAMPQQFATEAASVIVLLGTDTAPEVVREQQGLRPKQRNDVLLPLADDVPRDRYVPGLAAVNLYTEQNENNPASAGQLADMAWFFRRIGYCSKYQIGTPVPESCGGRPKLVELYQDVEELLEELGFTP